MISFLEISMAKNVKEDIRSGKKLRYVGTKIELPQGISELTFSQLAEIVGPNQVAIALISISNPNLSNSKLVSVGRGQSAVVDTREELIPLLRDNYLDLVKRKATDGVSVEVFFVNALAYTLSGTPLKNKAKW